MYEQKDEAFFENGKLFAIPWSDQYSVFGVPAGWPCPGSARTERIFFVIQKSRRDNYCSVVEILQSSDAKGTSGAVYTGSSPPRHVSSRNTIRIRCDDQRLVPSACVDFDNFCTLDYSIPVRHIGKVHRDDRQDLDNFIQQILKQLHRARATTAGSSSSQTTRDFGDVQAMPGLQLSIRDRIQTIRDRARDENLSWQELSAEHIQYFEQNPEAFRQWALSVRAAWVQQRSQQENEIREDDEDDEEEDDEDSEDDEDEGEDEDEDEEESSEED